MLGCWVNSTHAMTSSAHTCVDKLLRCLTAGCTMAATAATASGRGAKAGLNDGVASDFMSDADGVGPQLIALQSVASAHPVVLWLQSARLRARRDRGGWQMYVNIIKTLISISCSHIAAPWRPEKLVKAFWKPSTVSEQVQRPHRHLAVNARDLLLHLQGLLTADQIRSHVGSWL
jgi:hypothetical protein